LVLLLTAAAPPPGAVECSGCHGTPAPIIGRDAKEMTATLLAFRSGERPSTVMQRITKGFDPNELGSIAAWWSGKK
jgi:cytochrome c553